MTSTQDYNGPVNNPEITQADFSKADASCKEPDLPVCLFTAEKRPLG
jgi:hypothetical protein